ncbi:MAG: galactokinase [Blastocatellia bacterium]|nr:galactokinase [Blastocatellia bacterium]
MYGSEPRLFSAPGRVNLIGEHTDYNDGFVLPMALERATVVAAAPRNDRRVRVRSLSLHESAEFDLDQPGPTQRGIWLDYVEGVAQSLLERGARLRGADLMIDSDVPVGAGLSSSAALEVSVGLALLSIAGEEMDRVSLALAGQRAEHVYVGTMCGIMDQFVAALGEEGHALLIDCRALTAVPLPLDTSSMVVAICDTNVKHALASSEYNTRRAECERGVQILSEALPGIRALRDVSVDDFLKHEERLPEPVRRRCRHVVTEDARTLAAAEALRAGELEKMGQLMVLSHASLRDDYEVSCRELDIMVEIALKVEGVAGARMTGGGFGGSTVNLVRRDALEEFREAIEREYNKATNKHPTIYISEPGAGAKEIQKSGV